MNEMKEIARAKLAAEVEESKTNPSLKKKRTKYGPLIPVCIPIAVYFDGIQLFKKRVCKFVPLIIAILSLPPTFRSVLGVGMFLLGICSFGDGKKKSLISLL